MINIPGEYIYRDDLQPTVYNKICSDSIDESIKIFIRIVTMEMVSFVIAVFGQLYSYVNYGTKSTFYCVRLPYFNADPDLEFIMNISWESFVICFALICFLGIDVVLVIIIDAINVSSRLCELRLDELSDNLEKKRGTEEQTRQQLRIIMMQAQFFDE